MPARGGGQGAARGPTRAHQGPTLKQRAGPFCIALHQRRFPRSTLLHGIKPSWPGLGARRGAHQGRGVPAFEEPLQPAPGLAGRLGAAGKVSLPGASVPRRG